MITVKDIEGANFKYAGHGDIEFVDDQADKTRDRHKGYTYEFQCKEYPRLAMRPLRVTLGDGGTEVEYIVDGIKVDNIGAAAAALNSPEPGR